MKLPAAVLFGAGLLTLFCALAEYPALLYYSVLCGRYDGSSTLPGMLISSARLGAQLLAFLTLSGVFMKRYHRLDLGGLCLGMSAAIILHESIHLLALTEYFSSDLAAFTYSKWVMYSIFLLCIPLLWQIQHASKIIQKRYSPFAFSLCIAAAFNCSWYLSILGLPIRCIALALLGWALLQEAKTATRRHDGVPCL